MSKDSLVTLEQISCIGQKQDNFHLNKSNTFSDKDSSLTHAKGFRQKFPSTKGLFFTMPHCACICCVLYSVVMEMDQEEKEDTICVWRASLLEEASIIITPTLENPPPL
jgi:hypothetical protein